MSEIEFGEIIICDFDNLMYSLSREAGTELIELCCGNRQCLQTTLPKFFCCEEKQRNGKVLARRY